MNRPVSHREASLEGLVVSQALASEPRAVALFGDQPRVTLADGNDPGHGLSLRLVRVGTSVSPTWIGLVDDRAQLLDRVRMGLRPSFVLHHDVDTPTISGELDVKIIGPVHDAPASVFAAAARLLEEQPFGVARAILIEVAPRTLALEPILDREAHGAVPRT